MADNDQTPETETETPAGTSSGNRRRGRARANASKPAPPDPSKLRFFRVIPEGTNIQFIANRRRAMLVSLVMILISIGAMVFNVVNNGTALNYGIDFQGGSTVRLALTQAADMEELRGLLEDEGYSGSSAVTVPDAQNEVLIRVKETIAIAEDDLAACRASLDALDDAELLEDGFVHPKESSKIFMKFTAQPAYADIERLMGAAGCEGTASSGVGKIEEFPVEFALIGVGADIAHMIDERLGAGTVDHIVASETVGAKVGSQLKRDGIQALLVAVFAIFLYVMLRFDLRFAPGGIVALLHDAFLVVGAFALTGKEFNLQSIAAVLTVVGYSINDTIVVFDRIRERVALFRDMPVPETTNAAINETLSRTVLTTTTTMIVVVSIWVLGSGPIKDFAFALFVGLVAGTYSSIFMASPVFLWVNDKMYKGKGLVEDVDADAEVGTGTLLGPQVEADEQAALGEGGDRPAIEAELIEPPDAGSVIGPRTGEGPQASADVQSAATAEPVTVADVDKQVGERKTRRRRRRPKDE